MSVHQSEVPESARAAVIPSPHAPATQAPATPGPAAAGRRGGFRPDIEGLRAVAVLSVVLYHAGVGVLGGGYVGVDVFFVISGFLITTNLYREVERTGGIRFGAFYGRRMIRLLPASTLVLVATVAAAWQWMSPLVAKTVDKDAIAAAAYGMNVRLAVQGTDYLSAARAPSPLQHFWSLAVEEQFYFIWPALLVVASGVWLRRRRGLPSRRWAALTLAVLAAVSLVLCVWQTPRSQPWAYFGIQARAWELAAGALVALAAPRLARLPRAAAETLMWVGLAAVLVAVFGYTDATVFPGYAAVLPVAGAALAIAGGTGPARGGVAVLGVRPMRVIGGLSYSWYLWHWPVLTIAGSVAGRQLPVAVRVGLAVGSVVPAWLSMRLVENPIRFRAALRGRPRWGLALGAALGVLSIGCAGFFGKLPVHLVGRGHAPDTAAVVAAASGSDPATRFSVRQRALASLVARSATTAAMPANLVPTITQAPHDFPGDSGCLASLDATSTADAIAAGCDRYGDANASSTMVLFGDSHVEQWFDAVNAVAKQRGMRLVVLTKSGCTPAQAFTTKLGTHRAFTECATWRQDALARIAALKPSVVLMGTRTYGSPVDADNQPVAGSADQLWTDALMQTADRVRQSGARVVVLQDTPDPRGLDGPVCVSGFTKDVQRCALPAASAVYSSRIASIAAAARAAGMPVIDPTPWFCTATVCPAVIGDTMVYRDGSHVTATYITLLAPLLGDDLAAALSEVG